MPDSWLRYLQSSLDRAQLRVLLRPLLDLPVERVLVPHGQPVLEGGRNALAAAAAVVETHSLGAALSSLPLADRSSPAGSLSQRRCKLGTHS